MLVPAPSYYAKSEYSWDPSTGIFKMDDVYHRLLTIDAPPEDMRAFQFEDILLGGSIPNLRLVANLRRGNHAKRVDYVLKKARILEYQAKTDKTKLMAATQAAQEAVDLGNDTERVWLGTHLFHIWDQDIKNVVDWTRQLKTLGEKADGITMEAETQGAFPYLRSLQPGWTRDRDRYREFTYNTRQALSQMPLCGQPTMLGGKMGAVFETSTGSLYNFWPFDTRYINYHSLVAGSSNTGKTFLTAWKLVQMLRLGVPVTVIDPKGDYRNLCEAVNGTYIDYDLKNIKSRINPLYIPAGRSPDEDDLNQMSRFMERMLVDPAKHVTGRLTREQMVALDGVIQMLFSRETKEITIRDLREPLAKYPGGAELATGLGLWTNGRYANLFDGTNQADLSNAFTVIDVSSIKDNSDIMPLALLSLMNLVTQTKKNSKHEFSVFVADECGILFQNPIMSKFLEEAFRMYRSLGIAMIGVSQNISDWTNIRNPTAIMNQISHSFLLRQSSVQAAKDCRAARNFSEVEEAHLTSLSTKTGYYSECLLTQNMANGGLISHRLITRPSPLMYAMQTSRKSDKLKIEEYRQNGMSFVDAITKFSQIYPTGVL
jgi:hypothetical protein